MNRNGGVSPTLQGALVIALFFVLLVVGEKLFTQRKFSFEFKKPAAVHSTFPLDILVQTISDPTGLPALGKRNVSTQAWFDHFYPAKEYFLVNFWATWCAPCLEEIPSLELLSRQLALSKDPKSPVLLTISVDDSAEEIRKLFAKLELVPTFPVVLDRSGVVARSVSSVRFPETLLIRRNGEILYRWIGPQNWMAPDALRHLASLGSAK